ncbi:MAG: pyridoxamine 5'-phosphate oxidase family protein [Clostridiales bacterium]|nr:pyridoxamine 5'-phosphate oxidase family protein [Clostridiales bacterium]
MQEIIDFIKETGVGYFATVEGQQPRVRAFGFGYYEDGKFWFCTNNTKKVYSQLQANPYAEVFFSKPDFSQFLRLSGHAVFDTSLEAKTKVMDAMPAVKGLYQGPDNPIFEVFYLEKGEAVLEKFPPTEPPKVVKF